MIFSEVEVTGVVLAHPPVILGQHIFLLIVPDGVFFSVITWIGFPSFSGSGARYLLLKPFVLPMNCFFSCIISNLIHFPLFLFLRS